MNWNAISEVLDAADRKANPIGAIRTCAATPRIEGCVSIDGLPGLWQVRRSWDESGVWMHEIERIR